MTNITLVGIPLSTFTRTLRMAFYHLKVDYRFEKAVPYSDNAYKYHPFGRVPSLVVKDKVLIESSVIREFIDTTIDSRLTPNSLDERLKMLQVISSLSDYVFHQVVAGVAKPRHYYESQGLTEEEIQQRLKKKLQKAGEVISAFDTLCSQQGPFLCGPELTWADYFVFPPFADLYSLPESGFFQQKGPRVHAWYQKFKDREEVQYTYPKTFADIRYRREAHL